MIKVKNIEVFNFEGAIRGMRNPMNSWDKSDSYYKEREDFSFGEEYVIGKNDLSLMKKLYKAGAEHRKYLRQCFVSMDITAPLYWWKEADTYKIGTTGNSCSTMHTIHKTGITNELFSFDDGKELTEYEQEIIDRFIHMLEDWRSNCKSGDETWRSLIQYLPQGFNQKRTVTMNYENVFNIIHQRSNHKLSEWREFCDILKELPYVKEIMKGVQSNNE